MTNTLYLQENPASAAVLLLQTLKHTLSQIEGDAFWAIREDGHGTVQQMLDELDAAVIESEREPDVFERDAARFDAVCRRNDEQRDWNARDRPGHLMAAE